VVILAVDGRRFPCVHLQAVLSVTDLGQKLERRSPGASLRAFCRILDWHCFSSNTRLRYSNAESILIYGLPETTLSSSNDSDIHSTPTYDAPLTNCSDRHTKSSTLPMTSVAVVVIAIFSPHHPIAQDQSKIDGLGQQHSCAPLLGRVLGLCP
jgi:hypothetical protein